MKEKYDKIGVNYNTTRKADPYLFSRLLALLQPSPNGKYLDIGCGTGNYTKEFDKKGYQFIGVDPSRQMLEKAKTKTNNVIWKLGKVEKLGLPSNCVDGITASLTLHHWQDLNKGFNELNRVLKTDGRMVFFTATPKQMQGYWLHHYFPKMLKNSITQMPTYDTIKSNLETNKLIIEHTERYFIKPDLENLFLYSGKHNPSLYFETKVRNGISSFSSLSNTQEVEKGLEQLKKDIESSKIDAIIKSYENTDGDYLFIVVKKALSNTKST